MLLLLLITTALLSPFCSHSTDAQGIEFEAVLIDPQWDESLQLVLDNFLAVLPQEVRIYWYTFNEEETVSYHSIFDSVNKAFDSGRLQVRQTAEPLTKSEYNRLLSTPWMWSQHEGKYVLLFERDTVLCGQSTFVLQDFAKFKFIGAPWPAGMSWCTPGAPCCCNSGLSLSNATSMEEYMRTTEDDTATMYPVLKERMNWDWYLQQLVLKGDLTMPSEREAQSLSVESVWHRERIPFGVHKPWWGHYIGHNNATDLAMLEQKCPEVKRLCAYAMHSRDNKNPRHGKAAQFFFSQICKNRELPPAEWGSR